VRIQALGLSTARRRRRYNEWWLMESQCYQTPNQARTDSAAASRGLDAGPTCRKCGLSQGRVTSAAQAAILQARIPSAQRVGEVISTRGLSEVIGGTYQ
jgi:hypothetical protein